MSRGLILFAAILVAVGYTCAIQIPIATDLVNQRQFSGFTAKIADDDTTITVQDHAEPPADGLWKYCEDPAKNGHLWELESVTLAPIPLVPGQLLNVAVTGHLSEDLLVGSSVNLKVIYNNVGIENKVLDLCNEVLPRLNASCPVEHGRRVISQEVLIPEDLPPGKYSARVHVTNQDGNTVFCMVAKVEMATNLSP